MKRSKNIFNSPIVHESLMEEEGNREFTIGNKSIDSNWLKGINQGEYRRYIASALTLTDLQKELDDLKQQESKENKRSNIFKISRTRQKIDGLDLVEIKQQQPMEQSLTKNQPPESEAFIVQKLSSGFFKTLLERKCLIHEKQFFIETQKDQKQRWVSIHIEKYNIELEDKDKMLERDLFKQFAWLSSYKQRVLLWSEDELYRPYCVYAQQNELKKFQRYFQVQKIEVKQLNVFKTLDTQFRHKVVTIFGNKVRFYDHFTKIRRAQKDAQFLAIKKILGDQNGEEKQMEKQYAQKQKQKQNEPDNDHSSQISQSGLLQSRYKEKAKHSQQVHQSLISLDDSKSRVKINSKQNSSKRQQNSIFKLNLKKSMVFYEELLDPVEFDEEKQGYSVQDINLNLKEEVGVSQVDQQSQYQVSSFHERPRKITKMTVQNVWDESQKFKINIFEVSSVEGERQKHQSQANLPTPQARSTGSLQLFGIHHNEDDQEFKRNNSLRISQIGDIKKVGRKLHRQSSDIDSEVLQYFQLQKSRPSDEEQSFESQKNTLVQQTIKKEEKNNYLIKNFMKRKINELQIVLNDKPQDLYLAIAEIRMMIPYHSQQIDFQIIQLDPDLQMQNKIVACGISEGMMREQKTRSQKHMLYHCQQQKGLFFKMSKISPFFVFVLQQESKQHYIHFQIDPNPKYQRNQSHLLMTQLDNEGYPFAICLVLYTSPTPIEIKPAMGTIEFMKQYLASQDYNFKHDFIDDKRRLHQIRQKWNIIQNRYAVKQGDAQTFSKTVFLGLPDSIFNQIKSKVTYNPKRLLKFTESEGRMIEENILSNLYEVRSFTKPCLFVTAITKAYLNQCFRKRLEQVYVYFVHRYGSYRNLAIIFMKVILDKLEPILILCRKQEQIQAIINLYAEVEYQIDQVFTEVSKYFKK